MIDFNEIYKDLTSKGVEEGQDFDSQPKPLDGQYVGEIKKVAVFPKEDGESNISFSIQIEQTISGVNGNKRYLNKQYSTGATTFADKTTTKVENFEKLLGGLKTMGLWNEQMTFASQEALIEHVVSNAVGKKVNIRTYPTKSNGVVKRDKNGYPKQTVYIVKEFKLVEKKADEVADKSTEIPF